MNALSRAPHIARYTSSTATRLRQLSAHLSRPTFTASISAPHAHFRTMAPIPKTMKGVLIEKTGGVEVLDHRTNLPVPTPKDDEVLVHNELIGVNFIDTYFRTGLYPSEKPLVLGREAEGNIVTLGSKAGTHFKEGQRVTYMHTSAYAEYTAVPAKNLFAVPDKLAKGLAAASVLQGLTAITLIEEAHKVNKGDWVLVHAAAGGVGQWLVQTLKAKGAHTIATASTDEKRALAKKFGAEIVTGYEHDALIETIKKATNGAGVVAAFDGVGKDTFDVSLEAIARKGTVVSFGNASGAVPPFAIAKLSGKNAKVVRPTLFNYLVTDEERERYGSELFGMLLENRIEVGIHKTYALSDIKQAHTDLEGRKTTGKLLLDPSK